MFAIENVTGFRMIEATRARIPVDHLESRPVVVGVAFHAGGALRSRLGESGMQPAVLVNLSIDFAMTVKATELRRTRRDRVALRAIGASA